MNLRTEDLTQTRHWLSGHEREAVGDIIKSSFSNVAPADYLAKYFDGPEAFQRKLRLYFDGERLVGYCLLTFTRESGTTIIRASAAFYPQYRKGGNTFQFSLVESLKYWLRRPWRTLYYADTMLSPAMYRAIAKNIGIIWPHPKHKGPSDLFDRFNHGGEMSRNTSTRCLVRVDRTSRYSASELDDFRASDKPEIHYYQLINPEFNNGVALFVIIPVHFTQFFLTALKKLGVI